MKCLLVLTSMAFSCLDTKRDLEQAVERWPLQMDFATFMAPKGIDILQQNALFLWRHANKALFPQIPSDNQALYTTNLSQDWDVKVLLES